MIPFDDLNFDLLQDFLDGPILLEALDRRDEIEEVERGRKHVENHKDKRGGEPREHQHLDDDDVPGGSGLRRAQSAGLGARAWELLMPTYVSVGHR